MSAQETTPAKVGREYEIIVCHRFNVPLPTNGYHTQYIGRPSSLGSPFNIGKHGSREEVVDKYEGWLLESIVDGTGPQHYAMENLAALIRDSGGIILTCWCKPLTCHRDTIAKILRAVYLSNTHG